MRAWLRTIFDPPSLHLASLAVSFSIMSEQTKIPAQSARDASDHDVNLASQINGRLGGWAAAMHLHFLYATGDQVIAELEVGPVHHQAYGIVHGGVYAGMIESVASVGAALWARRYNQTVVGLENQTSFLVATREGRLTATALPLMRGRRTQVWQAKVTNEKGQTVAEGKVRLISLDQGAAIAGETVKMKSSDG
jgi:1,4-dihydroxy-2-naphthoyl-CoA hydrolase